MTAFGSVETAVRAVKVGAFDYISKPFRIDEVLSTVRRALLVQAQAQSPADLGDPEGVEDGGDHRALGGSGVGGRESQT